MQTLRVLRLSLISLLLLSAPLVHSVSSSDDVLIEVIQLKYQKAEGLLPLLREISDNSITITGSKYTLVVKGTKAQIKGVKKLVAKLDKRPKNLIVSVKKGSQEHFLRRQSTILTPNIYSTEQTNEKDIKVIKVLEGYSGIIAIGEEFPVYIYYGYDSVDLMYKTAISGIEVTPRLLRGEVVVTIRYIHQSRANDETYKLNIEKAESTIRIPLGKWRPLGGVKQSSESRQEYFLYETRIQHNKRFKLYIKVDIAR